MSCLAFIIATDANIPFWNIDKAMAALSFMCCGYYFHKYENRFSFLDKGISQTAMLVLIIIIKTLEISQGVYISLFPHSLMIFAIFFVDAITFNLLLISLTKRIPRTAFISFVGQNSIIYYFLSGGTPLLTSILLNKSGLPFDGNYLNVVIAFAIVTVVATIITYLICKYIPFITGRKPRRIGML